jgi:hypothetical protein
LVKKSLIKSYLGEYGQQYPPCLSLNSELNFILKFEYLNNNAHACYIEVPDGNYELVPEPEGESAEGDVNVVEVQQDPNKSSEELQSEGKPRSITYFC